MKLFYWASVSNTTTIQDLLPFTHFPLHHLLKQDNLFHSTPTHFFSFSQFISTSSIQKPISIDMGVEKVTPMILKADLQCPCCYKKVKKTLCKFPQIRDQVYNEKTNTVAITVVCCSPEKVRDKLCSRGGRAIKSIEIIEPEKKKEPEKPKEKPKEADQKPAEKPKEKPKEADSKPKEAEKPKAAAAAEKPKDAPKAEPPKNQEPAAKPPQAAPAPAPAKGPEPAPVNGVPSVFPYIGPSYDAHSAGPYYHGYGFPPLPPPQPCYQGYYSHGHGHAYGYGGVAHANRCDSYFSEENPQACTIM